MFCPPADKFTQMTQTPIPRLVSTMAVPTIISMLITSLYNMADTFFVGRIGTSATAAVGVALPLMAVIQAIGQSFRATVLAMCRQGLFFLPAILILPPILGITGIQLSQPVSDLCSFLVALPMGIGVLRELKAAQEGENAQKG